MDHRQFFLALDFLYQRSSWNNFTHFDVSVSQRSTVHEARAKAKEGFRIDYIGIGLISLGLGSMQIILDKGEREDWFSSGLIQVFFVLMIIGIIAGILWELREKHPVVDLRMLKDRNFAVATLAMFFLGFCAVREHGADSPVLAANDGLHGGTGWAGVVSGRRG